MTGARKHSKGKGGTTTAQTSTLKKSASPSTLTPKKKGAATPASVTGTGTPVSPRGGSGVPTSPRRGGTSTPGSAGTPSTTLSGRPLVGGVPKAAAPKPPADAERRTAVTAAAAGLPALADHKADPTYLSTDDDAQYRDLHDAAVLTLAEIAGHAEITAAGRLPRPRSGRREALISHDASTP